MKAILLGTMALVLLPTLAFAADDAGKMSGKTNETTPAMEANKIKPRSTDAAGSGKGAASAPSSPDAAGTGGGEGSKMDPKKTP
jgi:hypothetical protein